MTDPKKSVNKINPKSSVKKLTSEKRWKTVENHWQKHWWKTSMKNIDKKIDRPQKFGSKIYPIPKNRWIIDGPQKKSHKNWPSLNSRSKKLTDPKRLVIKIDRPKKVGQKIDLSK